MPLPHRFTIAHAAAGARGGISYFKFEIPPRAPERVRAVCSLLRYSVGSPRLAVSQPAVLWCSDFPPAFRAISNLNRDLKPPRRERSPGLLRNNRIKYNR